MSEGGKQERLPNPIGSFPHAETPDRIPTLQLQSTIEEVNPNFQEAIENTPLLQGLQKGSKNHPLCGRFFDFRSIGDKSEPQLGRRARHFRAGLVGQVPIKDNQGRRYRDMVIKGAGHISRLSLEARPWTTLRDMILGLMDMKSARWDYQMSEELTALGIKTHRVIAIVRPDELQVLQPDGTVAIESVADLHAKKKIRKFHGKLRKSFMPAQQIQVYGTRLRIEDIAGHPPEGTPRMNPSLVSPPDVRRKAVLDAISLVNTETNGAVHDVKSYALWFATRLGEQIATMHKNGYVHRGLAARNITLDCGITDLDSVRKKRKSESLNDFLHRGNDEAFHDNLNATRALFAFYLYLSELFPREITVNENITMSANFALAYSGIFNA